MTETADRVASLALKLSNESQRNVTTYYDSLWRRLKAVLAGDTAQPLHRRLLDAADEDVSLLREARSTLATSSDPRVPGALRLLDSAIHSVG